MRRWIKRTLIAVFGATAIFGGVAAWAHCRPGHGWQTMSEQDAVAMKARIVEKVGRKFDLDAAQKAKLAILADKLHEQRNAVVGKGSDPRAELQALVAGPTFDRARASAMVESKLGALNEKSPAVLTALADFYDSLKPEQQSKLREMMARRGGWRS